MLREFLYVDTDKVRSLLAQIDGSVGEEVRITEKDQTKLTLGAKNFIARDKDTGAESSVTRSLADGVFPALEEAMETSGYLVDLSNDLQDPDFWTESLQDEYPAGSFVRITAPARLFDSLYVARVFAGLAATANGFLALNPAPQTPRNNKSRGGGGKSKGATAEQILPEDEIEDFPPDLFGGGFDARQLRGFAKMTRGMFHPGLHMIMNPAGQDDLSITVRLQEGRSFLESDAEILFARYGVYEQDWTVVGTIGSHSSPDEAELPDGSFGSRPGGIERAAVTAMVNSMLGLVAGTGFADLPQYPGFSVVPFAVYRPILQSVEFPETDGSTV
ncbi:hypothetical protein [Micromonospora aurantiaca]|uniref:DUF6414 family protein n=1 Tax=Micromonospora aurantiaca (nom. illeg.) TaxID=47850 RepID=UPI0037F24186